jgi:hypothetical protein
MPTNETGAGPLRVLEQIQTAADARDTAGHFRDRMRVLCRDYGDLTRGAWQPTPDRAAAVFTEHFALAIHEAREANLPDLAAALIAVRPSIIETAPRP